MSSKKQRKTENESIPKGEEVIEKFDIRNMDWEALKNVDPTTVDRSTLVDINDVVIDTSLSKEERIVEFVRQVKNPYCLKVGKVAISISFSNNGRTFEERMEHYIQTL